MQFTVFFQLTNAKYWIYWLMQIKYKYVFFKSYFSCNNSTKLMHVEAQLKLFSLTLFLFQCNTCMSLKQVLNTCNMILCTFLLYIYHYFYFNDHFFMVEIYHKCNYNLCILEYFKYSCSCPITIKHMLIIMAQFRSFIIS